MATAREDAEARFPSDIATHRMTVIKDDGVYRHLRFRRPDTNCYSFDILTWPGYLAYVGDMGDYVFQRRVRTVPEDALTLLPEDEAARVRRHIHRHQNQEAAA